MKKLISTLILIIAAIPQLFAQAQRSAFKIRLSDGSPLVITIDDRRYSKHSSSLTIGDLPPGKHNIKVYAYNPYRNREGGRATLLYSGKITIAAGTFSLGIVDVKGGSMRVSSELITGQQNNNGSYPTNNNHQENNALSDTINRNSPRYTSLPSPNITYPNQVNAKDMTDLKDHAENKITDADKLKLMKSALDGRRFSTEQVDDMLHWFNFDDTKLDFAKWAYTSVTDPANYWKLESVFSFNSTKDNFQKYINNKK